MERPNALVLTESNRDVSGTVLREAGKLGAFIRARVRNAADAEDILQDVFFELVQADRLTASIENVSAWLFRVARNRIIDRFRRQKTSSLDEAVQQSDRADDPLNLDIDLPALDGDPEAELARANILAVLQQALDELPASQREIFVAHEIEGLSFEGISRRNGVPVNTLLSRKRYAVLYLRERLQVFYDDLQL